MPPRQRGSRPARPDAAKPEERVELSDSNRTPAGTRIGPVQSTEPIEVTIRLRGRPDADLAALGQSGATPEEVAAAFAAAPADATVVEQFATDAGLQVLASEPGQRRVVASGTPAQLQAAFGVELAEYSSPHGTYRGREGTLSVPTSIGEIVTGVFGLDERRQARPHLVRRAAHTIAVDAQRAAAYTPLQLAEIYQFPVHSDGATQTIGILEFGGGFSAEDLRTYFTDLGVSIPEIVTVGVDGATNDPQPGDDSPDGEVTLDIEVAGALAPGAKIVVYFAPFTERGWVDVVTRAATDTEHQPSVLSISWGWPEGEDLWTGAALKAVEEAFAAAAAAAITVFAASGDDGAADEIADGRVHVDFPAASPLVTGVGGTTIKRPDLPLERVWNNGPRAEGGGASGGGVSTFFPIPDWQKSAAVPLPVGSHTAGRGVPDVSAAADPNTGYVVLVHGTHAVVGGTSAAAPLWAGLTARLNQALGRRMGPLNPQLYGSLAARGGTFDVKNGNNDTTGQLGGYRSKAGWDPCTGWGSPNGTALLTALQATHRSRNQTTWTRVPGAALSLAAGLDGSLWAIGTSPAGDGYGLHEWTGAEWAPLAGAAAHVAVAPNGNLYTTDLSGNIAERVNGSWQAVSGIAYATAVDAEGMLWATAPDIAGGFGVYRGSANGAWMRIAGPVVWISAAQQVYGLDPQGSIYKWSGDNWQRLPGGAVTLVAGADGSLWALGPDWLGQGFGLHSFDGVKWTTVPGQAVSLAVDTAGRKWAVTTDGGIYVS